MRCCRNWENTRANDMHFVVINLVFENKGAFKTYTTLRMSLMCVISDRTPFSTVRFEVFVHLSSRDAWKMSDKLWNCKPGQGNRRRMPLQWVICSPIAFGNLAALVGKHPVNFGRNKTEYDTCWQVNNDRSQEQTLYNRRLTRTRGTSRVWITYFVHNVPYSCVHFIMNCRYQTCSSKNILLNITLIKSEVFFVCLLRNST